MVVVGGEEGTEEKDVDKERQESCTQGAGIYCREDGMLISGSY